MLNKKIFILVLFLHTFIQLVQSNDPNETASNMEVCVEKNGCNVNVVFTGIQNFVETFITNIVDEVVDVVMTPYSSPSNTKNFRKITTTTSTPRLTDLIGNDKRTTFFTAITIRPTDKPTIDTTSTNISPTPLVTPTDYQQNSKDFLLYKTSDGLFMRPYHLKNANISAINITDSLNLSTIISGDERYQNNEAFTIDCKNKIIYILKTSKTGKKVVDVMNYNEHNKFERIYRIFNTFDSAQSIASDTTTGRIYFTEIINSSRSSIKFTNEHFKISTLLTHSDEYKIKSKIIVYPKLEIIIFSDFLNFFYTSTLPNSIPKTLYPFRSLIMNISDFAIDYALDKFCWITSQDGNSSLYCADIIGSNQSIDLQNTSRIERILKYTKNLVVFNNTFYWTAEENNKNVLFFKNDKDEPVKVIENLEKNRNTFFFSLNCLYSVEDDNTTNSNSTDQQRNLTNLLLYATKTEFFTLPYSTINLNLTKIAIKDSSNFSEINTFDDKNVDIEKITVNCANNNIYILKSIKGDNRKVLDVIHYNNNNKFERTYRIFNMFDNAESIISDWTTGKLYWKDEQSSIRFTDESFKHSNVEYSNRPINKILIYPKQKTRFFSDFDNFRYSSTTLSESSFATLLVPKILYSSKDKINDFAIDYALDKLCWITSQDRNSSLYCGHIVGSNQLINLQNITDIETFPKLTKNLIVFNNTFYFTAEENNKQILYFKNGNETAVEVDKLEMADLQLSFFSSNCPK